MNTLNDRIIVRVTTPYDLEPKIYKYEVVVLYPVSDIQENTKVIFVGNIFVDSKTTSKDIDITDIVSNDKWVPFKDRIIGYTFDDNPIYNWSDVWCQYIVRLYGDSIFSSSIAEVAKIYNYPHYKESLNVWFNPTTNHRTIPLVSELPHYPTNDNFPIYILTESSLGNDGMPLNYTINGALYGNINDTTLSPTQLLKTDMSAFNLTDIYNYQTGYITTNMTRISTGVYQFEIIGHNYDFSLNYGLPDTTIFSFRNDGVYPKHVTYTVDEVSDDLKDALSNGLIFFRFDEMFLQVSLLDYDFTQADNLTIEFDLEEPSQETYRLSNIQFSSVLDDSKDTKLYINDYESGVIDLCPSPYYLIWQDRNGSFQSQPFNEKATYSESFDKKEVLNYYDKRILNNVQVQGKWKINSNWITEDKFPIYESIYVSPIVQLYDTNESQLYDVIVTGEWTEKNYKNQKSLISLTLDLELAGKQNILY